MDGTVMDILMENVGYVLMENVGWKSKQVARRYVGRTASAVDPAAN